MEVPRHDARRRCDRGDHHRRRTDRQADARGRPVVTHAGMPKMLVATEVPMAIEVRMPAEMRMATRMSVKGMPLVGMVSAPVADAAGVSVGRDADRARN